MATAPSLLPAALVTLRAHRPAPARIEVVYRGTAERAMRAGGWLVLFWGAVPLLMAIPPYYGWAIVAIILGGLLAHGEWAAPYRVRAFAAICPRCARPLELGTSKIDLPRRLSCYHCHFEPVLEVRPELPEEELPEHRVGGCTGRWAEMWLADQPYVVCWSCGGYAVAAPAARRAAAAENDCADVLDRLAEEGRWLI